MRKQLKQYGIYGMAEQTMLVSLGSVQFKVSFAHGCMTTLGVKPAVYSTDNYVIQTAIEQSPDFKSGIIKLVRTTDLGEEVYTGPSAVWPLAGPGVQSGANGARHGAADGAADSAAADGDVAAAGAADVAPGAPHNAVAGADGGVAAGVGAEGDVPLSFDTLDLAKQWLEKTVGVSSANCRRSEIVRIAKDHGFTITIK